MATGLDAYGGIKLRITSAVVQAGNCVICGLPNGHAAAPEDTYLYTREVVSTALTATFVAHPTCWRNFHANQPFAVYLP